MNEEIAREYNQILETYLSKAGKPLSFTRYFKKGKKGTKLIVSYLVRGAHPAEKVFLYPILAISSRKSFAAIFDGFEREDRYDKHFLDNGCYYVAGFSGEKVTAVQKYLWSDIHRLIFLLLDQKNEVSLKKEDSFLALFL